MTSHSLTFMSWIISPVHAELARGTTGIQHIYFNEASSKRVAYRRLIGLDDERNTREVFQEQQQKINK